MKPGAHVVLAASSRFYTPLIALFACLLLAGGVAGSGVGFTAGLAFALLLALHALVFGADTARAALPPVAARALLALGVAMSVTCAGLNGFRYAQQIIEAGVFVALVATAAIVIHVLFGRAPTLRDEGW